MKRFLLSIIFYWILCVGLFSQNWNEIINSVPSPMSSSDFTQYGYSVAVSGDYAVVGAPLEDRGTSSWNPYYDNGVAYVFNRVNGSWVLKQKLTFYTEFNYMYGKLNFGCSVAISGDWIVVGSKGDFVTDANDMPYYSAGSITLFQKNSTGTFVRKQYIECPVKQEDMKFGESVAIYQNLLVVGAPGYNKSGLTNVGCAYVYRLNSSTARWDNTTLLTANDGSQNDYFGSAVDAYYNNADTYVVVGSKNKNSNSGAVYVFRNYMIWHQKQKITEPNSAAGTSFGCSVAMDGNYLVIGSDHNSTDANNTSTVSYAGAVFVYKRNPSTAEFGYTTKLVAPDRHSTDYFGRSVALSGNYLIAGAPMENHDKNGSGSMKDPGSAYIFYNNGGTWEFDEKCVASNRATEDYFGSAVAIDGNSVVIGAPMKESPDNGKAYGFNKVALEITTQPLDATMLCSTGQVSYSVETVGAKSYQWQVQEGNSGFVNITDGGVYSGVTTRSLTLSNAPTTMDQNNFRCIVNDGITLLNSNAAGLSFQADLEAPVIVSSHPDITINTGQLPDYTGTIVATDNCDTNLSYTQTPVSGTIISGSNNLITLTAIDISGNSRSVSFNVSVDQSTAINTSELQRIVASPNPTRGEIMLTGLPETVTSISVLAIQGNKVMDLDITGSKATIDLSAFDSGIYFVVIQTSQGPKIIKIVKQ